MNFNILVENITRKEEHDVKAQELESLIRRAAEKCENIVRWTHYWYTNSDRNSKDLLERHGYQLKYCPGGSCGSPCDYFISFDENSPKNVIPDKRMLSASEMYEVYLQAKLKRELDYELKKLKDVYDSFNNGSLTSIETDTHYLRTYHYTDRSLLS